jgi:NAD(P)H-dependent nitrite reductase small subunit
MGVQNKNETDEVHFHVVGRLDDFLVRIGRTVQVKGSEIAVFRASDDRLFALDNTNPHRKGGPLAEGILSGYDLYDPLYDTKICLLTGKVHAPDTGQVRTYPVHVEGLEVRVGMPVAAASGR